MHPSQLHYLPMTLPSFSILVVIFLVLVALIEIRALRYAYMQLGMSSYAAFGLLLASLFGSAINIPVAQLPGEHATEGREVLYYGMYYVVPYVVDWPGTVIAVNVGGAVIPFCVSIYLLVRYQLWVAGLIATIGVAIVCHSLASPVPGVGIAIPIFAPPIVAALASLIVSWRHAAPLAYICGSLGTLIGADLTNLASVNGLGAPVASIGGAGTFDGIFLAGILAVLLASLIAPAASRPAHP